MNWRKERPSPRQPINARKFQLAAWGTMCRAAARGKERQKRLTEARDLERLVEHAKAEAA